MNLGCPGDFAGMSQKSEGVQKVCARFSAPYGLRLKAKVREAPGKSLEELQGKFGEILGGLRAEKKTLK